MKEREPRHDVQLPARLRGDDSWSDVCIKNVSSHGMMLLINDPPQRGTYIEVRRGSAVVIGRVMWVSAGRCGLRTKEKISVAELTMANAPLADAASAGDRRAQARAHHPGEAAARSAAMGRLMQFAATVALVLAAGGFIAHTTYGFLARPTAAISRAFG